MNGSGVVQFLSVDDVCAIHASTLEHEGGMAGVKNVGLLEAAVAMPRQQFAGSYLHKGLPAMAAAYLFHLCMNHPFNDGNKRAAAMASLIFLRLNGGRLRLNQKALEPVVLQVAGGEMNQTTLTALYIEGFASRS